MQCFLNNETLGISFMLWALLKQLLLDTIEELCCTKFHAHRTNCLDGGLVPQYLFNSIGSIFFIHLWLFEMINHTHDFIIISNPKFHIINSFATEYNITKINQSLIRWADWCYLELGTSSLQKLRGNNQIVSSLFILFELFFS